MEIKYSIIIPHKNIPQLLQRCLDSIPFRGDVQVIVVDDNSDSSIVNFENFPGIKRPNIEVYLTKEGRGAGYARNVGLQHVKGKWILFADADDAFACNFLNILDEYSCSDNDIVYFSITGLDHNNNKSYRDYAYDLYFEYAKYKDDMYLYYYSIYQPWGKLYSTKMIVSNNILFEEVSVSNDRLFSVKSVFYSNSISIDNRKIYISYTNCNSLTFKKDPLSEKIRLLVDINLNKFLISGGFEKYHINIYKLLWTRCMKFDLLYFFNTSKILLSSFSGKILITDISNFLIKETPRVVFLRVKRYNKLKRSI